VLLHPSSSPPALLDVVVIRGLAQGICVIASSNVSAAVASVLALSGLQHLGSTLLAPAKVKHATG